MTNESSSSSVNSENPSPGRPSFLDEILSASEAEAIKENTTQGSSTRHIAQTTVWATIGSAPVVAKKKTITPAQILRMIGGLLFVGMILFGSFLSYIVFNPGQAKFFINFGINPSDVASLLSKLVNGIFGSLSFILSVLFAYFLFKVYLSKGLPKKRAVYIIVSIFTGIVLFSNIGFWAYLFGKIGASDFVRPTGGVIVYNNDLLVSKDYKNQAEVYDVGNLLGPVTLRYDLSSDVLYASKTLEIEGYQVDCKNAEADSIHEWENPTGDANIICKYDKPGNYSPTGYYRGKDRVTREPKRIDIAFSEVKVVGMLALKETDTSRLFDASDLKKLWTIRWYMGPNFDTVASEDPKFSVKVQDIEQYLCLELQTQKENSGICDRIFTIPPKLATSIQGKIQSTQDPISVTKYSFRIDNLRLKDGVDVASISWFIGDDANPQWKWETFEKDFNIVGNYKVTAVVKDSEWTSQTFVEDISIKRALQLVKRGNESLLRVVSPSGDNLIKDSYDNDISAYHISNIQIPQKISLDATDIRVKDEGFELKDVEWKMDTIQKKWLKIDIELIEEKRYEIVVGYIFTRAWLADDFRVNERIVIEGKSKEIAPIMKISTIEGDTIDNLYVPVDVTFDASSSKVRTGKISQFIYDFGEGKEPSEWEAIKTYRYTIAGEYTVKLTAVKEDGTKETISQKIIIKDMPKKLEIWTSVSKGIVGKTVEFMTTGTIGQIGTYAWDFGDNSSTSNEPNPIHTFENAGKYSIKLSATYSDGTLRSAEMEFEVVAE